jgi:hypothetical protein
MELSIRCQKQVRATKDVWATLQFRDNSGCGVGDNADVEAKLNPTINQGPPTHFGTQSLVFQEPFTHEGREKRIIRKKGNNFQLEEIQGPDFKN